MSKFPPLGFLSAVVLKNSLSPAPAVIPSWLLKPLGFAMWTRPTRRSMSRTATYTDRSDRPKGPVNRARLAEALPHGSAEGVGRSDIITASSMSCGSCRGGWYRGTCHRGGDLLGIRRLAHESSFERIETTRSDSDRERVGRPTPAPRRQSSTAIAPRPPRPAGHAYTCLQESTAQAPCARRHGRALPRARTASGEHPRARWRRNRFCGVHGASSVHSASSSRQRICRGNWGGWVGWGSPRHVYRRRNLAQKSRSNRLRRSAARWVVELFLSPCRRNSGLPRGLRATIPPPEPSSTQPRSCSRLRLARSA